MSNDTKLYKHDGPFVLESGATLESVQVAYRTWGTLNATRDNAVLICHALTGSADADEWWSSMFSSEGKSGAGWGPASTSPFYPTRDFIVCSNVLGGCYGTTGPLANAPDGTQYRGRFPRITVRDIVALQRSLIQELGIARLQLVIGGSLGGMQALEWAATYPEAVESVAIIGAPARHSAWAIAWNEAQRQAIFADPNWDEGFYARCNRPARGIAVARMIAMSTYRSWESYDGRFGRAANGDTFDVESWLRHHGEKLDARFDANTYVALTRAMDSHDVARGRGDLRDVLGAIETRALVVAITSDVLYPPVEQEELARLLPNARLAYLNSKHGHDGFLIDTNDLRKIVSDFRFEFGGRVPSPALRRAASTNQELERSAS